MTLRRYRRTWTDLDREELLAAIGQCRQAFIAASTRAPISSALYRDLATAIAMLDELARELTGSREHFWGRSTSV